MLSMKIISRNESHWSKTIVINFNYCHWCLRDSQYFMGLFYLLYLLPCRFACMYIKTATVDIIAVTHIIIIQFRLVNSHVRIHMCELRIWLNGLYKSIKMLEYKYLKCVHSPYENIRLDVTSTEFNAPIWFSTAHRYPQFRAVFTNVRMYTVSDVLPIPGHMATVTSSIHTHI